MTLSLPTLSLEGGAYENLLSTSRPEKLLVISNVLYSIIFIQEGLLFLRRTPVRACASYLHSHMEGFFGERNVGEEGSFQLL